MEFQHSSQPRPVPGRPHYRQENKMASNIMFDRRVVRGSMYGSHRKNLDSVPPTISIVTSSRSKSKQTLKHLQRRDKSFYDFRLPDPSQDEIDQSEYLLEEEVLLCTSEGNTQTDNFQPQPQRMPYVPPKKGVNTGTQMTASDQPFDFNSEVVPLLEVVVQKTIEQALIEVEQECELDAIATDLRQLHTEWAAEAAHIEEIENDTIKVVREKQERMRMARERISLNALVREKVAGVQLMKQIWPVMLEQVDRTLEATGVWCNSSTYNIRSDVLPYLYEGVAADLSQRALGGRLVDSLLEEVISSRFPQISSDISTCQHESKKGGWIRIFLDGESLGLEQDKVVGPIRVMDRDTIADIELKIADWLKTEQDININIPSEGILRLSMDGKELNPGARLLDDGVVEGSTLGVLFP